VTDLVLKAEPDWAAAAQALIDGLHGQSTPDARVTVLQRVCDGLGEALYPGFVKLLAAVARFGDEEARRLAADALARVTGAIGVEDILGEVFSSFCIGK